MNFLPNILLVDENNQIARFHTLIKNNTIILNMFYSNCKKKCIPLGKHMKKVNLLLNKLIPNNRIKFISITLDPLNDNIEDLQYFKSQVYSNKCQNWHFYTGDYEDLEILRHKLSMYNPDPKIDAIKSNHSGSFMIFNEELGFIKHTDSFDNPIDIARKIVQLIPDNFKRHSYDLSDLSYHLLSEKELFDNIHTMNSMFTVPFLPKQLLEIYNKYGEEQRGFQYKPPIKRSCCCKKNK